MIKKSDQDEERLDRIEQLLKDLRKDTDAIRNQAKMTDASLKGLRRETDALKNDAAMADASQRPPTIPSRWTTDKTH